MIGIAEHAAEKHKTWTESGAVRFVKAVNAQLKREKRIERLTDVEAKYSHNYLDGPDGLNLYITNIDVLLGVPAPTDRDAFMALFDDDDDDAMHERVMVLVNMLGEDPDPNDYHFAWNVGDPELRVYLRI